ncbi:type I-C CRISPR-associated protein Cas5c [Psychrobacter phenylpyruvicus]|uniref:pre-crRNA processing endonuclease n=1 Tax=Psychrobacter phenylpyruvicus TaxID=29432 RepID=A0A379LKF2_9GAMM|nr:type I-C CRISPR-associated protein Cas5c [Psychrobacter phenylpyruvicus]SUD90575.1 CRISPR-associated protein Cas5, subtype I-C/DVULG [Psychrobacter phenylpyruvicus]
MFCIEVWGDYALFTRPEMKVERVSYPVITPSACRAIYEAILWKPAIEWQIKKVEVLSPIKWLSVRRNEVGTKLSTRNAQSMMNGKGKSDYAIVIDDNRQQRASLLLKDVRYRIYADFVLTDKAGPSDNRTKFAQMFERRAKKGQCFYQPYLGCREFSANFDYVPLDKNNQPQLDCIHSDHTNSQHNNKILMPITDNQDMGYMLYDLDFTNPDDPQPMFFHAKMNKGIIHIPEKSSDEVKR